MVHCIESSGQIKKNQKRGLPMACVAHQIIICSDRILTFGIRSIHSPAKVGLVVTELLITNPVVSWRVVGGTPPPPSTTAQLSFFAQPQLSEHLSLRGGLPSSSARLCLRLWWMDWTFSSTSNLSILSFSFSYVTRITNLPRGGESKVWCFSFDIRLRSPPNLY